MYSFIFIVLFASFIFQVSGLSGLPTTPYYILNDGYKMPAIGLATNAPLIQIPSVRQSTFLACKAGYRLFDTAALYADEVQVGQGLNDAICAGIVKREELFVITKLWNSNHARKEVVPALKRSLLRLNMKYVDLYLIQSPVAEDDNGTRIKIDYLQTWKGMEDARDLGLTRSIGVGNFNASELSRLVNNSITVPAVNKIEINPTFTNVKLVSYCQSLNIVVLGYCPFGFLIPRFNQNPPPPRFNDPVLVKIANKYNKLTSQVVLRYVIDRYAAVLVEASTYWQIFTGIDIFDFRLTEQEIEQIGKFNKNLKVYPLPIDSQLIRKIMKRLKNPLGLSYIYTDI